MIINKTVFRPSAPEDHIAVRAIHRRAFSRDAEADLAIALIEGETETIDLVAKLDAMVVGHVVLSKLDGPDGALGLGPLAVDPEWRDFQIGTELVRRALELGITLFDTADIYGNRGGSEEMLGRALGQERKDIILASKFGMKMDDAGALHGAKPAYIRRALEASLKRLGTDYLDIYFAHRYDPDVPMEEIVMAFHTRGDVYGYETGILIGAVPSLIAEVLDRLPLDAVPQPDDGVTYAAKIDKAEARIDWTRPAAEVAAVSGGGGTREIASSAGSVAGPASVANFSSARCSPMRSIRPCCAPIAPKPPRAARSRCCW